MKISHCPYCGNKTNITKNELNCVKCGKSFYINNTPSVGVLIVKNNKVLLSKRKLSPKKGFWDYPGGFLNFGEHPKDAAKREILEETGTVIEILDLLGVYTNHEYEFQGEKIIPLDTVYIAKIKSGKPTAQDDVDKIKWFPINKPPVKIAFGCVKNALNDLEEWLKKGHKHFK